MRLLFLPGNMCDARLWAPVMARLVAAGLECDYGDLTGLPSIAAMADAMLAQSAQPVVPVGFSMGAIVAAEMWRRASARIAGLGLVGFNATADLPERAAQRPRQQADVRAGQLARIVAEELKPNYLAEANRMEPGLRGLAMAMARDLGPAVFVQQSEALRTRDTLLPVLPTITVSTLLACGAEDRLCPPAWHRRWAAMIGASARLHVFADAGHLLPLEQPAALADAILAWRAHLKEPAWRNAS